LGQQLPDDLFRFLIIAFAEVVAANLSRRIDEIMGGPILIVEALPDRIVVIQRHRIGDSEFADRATHVA
jgi:hypothetical protein